MMNGNAVPISPELLEILRDPFAIQQSQNQGGDPGRLELVHNSWLVSPETGYKYPIRDGIPVMLIEEGRRWQQTAVADLPVPPPTPAAVPSSAGSETAVVAPSNSLLPILAAAITMIIVIILWQRLSND